MGFTHEPLKRFQTTCPTIIFVGRNHVTNTAHTKTDKQFKNKRSSENLHLHRVFRRPSYLSFSWTESTLRR
ncbi:hypothetical protein [Neisseria sicca]|uniref:hypothetical protein n=1 Tax=Neisseria sicca TaxID=490 RepID=UPI0011BD0DBB|nr:hypothetical protein [Neisseria sicca]